MHARRALLLVSLAAAMVALGHGFVLQKRLDGPTPYLTLDDGGDAAEYRRMIEGELSSARGPFRYRVLVPLLARLLPLPATDALRAITYISLFVAYVTLLLTCARVGITTAGAAAGLLILTLTPTHLYNYYNPYLTDAFQLAALCALVYALQRGSLLLFALAALAGVLARETTIFLVPAWMARNRWQGVGLLVVVGAALVLPRVLLPPDPGVTFEQAFLSYGLPRLLSPAYFALQIALCWQLAWMVSVPGVWFLRGRGFPQAGFASVLLLAGAVLSSLLATDIGRMFSILTPVIALGAAAFVDVLRATGRVAWISALGLVVIAQALVGIPNVLFGEEVRYGVFRLRLGLLAVGVIAGLAATLALRRELRTAPRDGPAA